jgi:GNAT superfamily N-acetyltransferase
MVSISIRAAAEPDVPLILAYIGELAEFERLPHEATEDRLRLTLFGARPAAEVLLAELSGEPAGFAVYFGIYSTFLARPKLFLEDLYVRPQARGRGVGRALLARLAKLAISRGCARLEWSVLRWNERAIRFYSGLGAQRTDEGNLYRLGGDALVRLAAEESGRPEVGPG